MFDKKFTEHLAELSKIGFSDAELGDMAEDMTDVIALMDKVRDFDEAAEPYTPEAVGYGKLRVDRYTDSYPQSEILKNADMTKRGSFVVPKVV